MLGEKLTDAEMFERAKAQAALCDWARTGSRNHPFVQALTNLISAYVAVAQNGQPTGILHGAQEAMATAVQSIIPIINHPGGMHD